jgi:hypothetical protein
MVIRRKEDRMEPSRTRRLLVTSAIVSALAVLMVAPANAYFVNEDGAGPTAAPLVGNPGDSAWIAQGQAAVQAVGNAGDGGNALSTRIAEPVGSTGSSGGIDTAMVVGLAGGCALVLAACGLFFTARHRRVALP